MFSLALVVKTEEHLLSYIEKNCSSFGHLWTLLGEMGACLAVGGKAWLSPPPKSRMWFCPFGLMYRDAVGETAMLLHEAASDYLASASITINFMWTKLLSNSFVFFFCQTDFFHVIGHGAVCDFKSVKSPPFHHHHCLFL